MLSSWGLLSWATVGDEPLAFQLQDFQSLSCTSHTRAQFPRPMGCWRGVLAGRKILNLGPLQTHI